jgi:ligand-binding SRPBCC domain-containing protein
MISPRIFRAPRISLFLSAAMLAAVLLSGPAKAQTSDADAVKAIETECNAIQDAVMALHPIRLALQSGTWAVLSDADYAVAVQTKASIRFADVYKQGANFAWVHVHAFDSQGNQRATQLCFRQADGTLERVRQATTVPDLAAASAKQAYYSSDGKIIQQTALYEVNDPAVAQKIAALPFYAVLPK